MEILESPLQGVFLLKPKIFRDERGYFYESYHQKKFSELGLDINFVQDNHSFSKQGTLRGLHYQLSSPQGKLVQVLQGEVFDVMVDIRKGSPTFGQWHGIYLSNENHIQVYIPPNFAHGFYVLSETAFFSYKCTEHYRPGDEYSIVWNDLDINIKWPIDQTPLLSRKDAEAPTLEQSMDNLPDFNA
ncbi:MAG TPA: dTDP-4-dehydrorhamnose 3,5-epimerase [Stenomitos sp.]